MSNVYTHSDFAVLSIMNIFTDDNWDGSTCYIQRKPESDYGNITTVTFLSPDYNREDFDILDGFTANIVPAITSKFSSMDAVNVVMSNSNISVNSYSMDGKLNT